MTARRVGFGLAPERVRRSIVLPVRLPISYASVAPVVMTLDVVTIVGSSLVAGMAYSQFRFADSGNLWHFLGIGLLAAALYVPAFRQRGMYEPSKLLSLGQQVPQIAKAWASVILLLLGIAFIAKIGDALSRGAVVGFLLVGFPALMAQRAFVRRTLRVALHEGSLRGPRITAFIFGQPEHRTRSVVNLQRFGYRIMQHYHLGPAGEDDEGTREAIVGALRSLRGSDVEEIFVVADWRDLTAFGDPLQLFQETPLPVRLLPDANTIRLIERPCPMIGRSGMVTLKRAPLSEVERLAKRGLDIVVAALALVLVAPLLLMTALAIIFDSRGPVFFVQHRNGFNGKPFRIFKFRTMSVQEDGAQVAQARKGDPRVTRVGQWLRRTSIDELPQLVNVLMGHMSIVGPRPHALAHDTHYARLIGKYAHRHHVKPGITGLAQVSGFRGETRTIDLMERRIEMDLRYINNWSLWRDVVIIARTVVTFAVHPNAY